LNNRLFTIAPTSHFKELAASLAVLAVVSRAKICRFESNFFIKFSTLLTGSLFNKFSIL